mmetsp:Transcript_30292/g.63820  ORF Transcript_30292/g.63820 Transcript_30292/m.63820 type:complete len:177 (-) Transcript_30292:845-1375(-)
MDRYYVYKDWSHVPSNQNDMRSIEKDESMHPAAQRLPTKLNKMLEDPDLSGIVVWRPHGRSWRIVNRDNFISKALPLYFQHSNFTSFVRLVNAWGFRRVTSGDDNDSYYHEVSDDKIFLATLCITCFWMIALLDFLASLGATCLSSCSIFPKRPAFVVHSKKQSSFSVECGTSILE